MSWLWRHPNGNESLKTSRFWVLTTKQNGLLDSSKRRSHPGRRDGVLLYVVPLHHRRRQPLRVSNMCLLKDFRLSTHLPDHRVLYRTNPRLYFQNLTQRPIRPRFNWVWNLNNRCSYTSKRFSPIYSLRFDPRDPYQIEFTASWDILDLWLGN